MKTQFDHILQSSFYLWLEFQLGIVGEAHETREISFSGISEGPNSPTNDLLYSTNVPEGMVAYHSPYRQFLALEDVKPDSEKGSPPTPPRFRKRITINGASHFEYPDAINGKDQIIIDYNNGRVLLDKNTFGTTAQVSGTFNVKTFNSYFTSEDEESILINSDFLLQNASLQTYLESKNKLGDKAYTVPAAFTTTSKTKNSPFAFGGLDETQSTITVVLITNTNYELDFGLSLLRDSAFSNFPIVPYEKFPYGEYFGVKPDSRRYKYTEFCDTCQEKAYISSVNASKLSDKSAKKIQKDLKVGFVDFEISSVRSPRSVSIPTPKEVGDVFENCVRPTPSSTESSAPLSTPTITPGDDLCLSSNFIADEDYLGSYYRVTDPQEQANVKTKLETSIPTWKQTGGRTFDIISYHGEIWNKRTGGIESSANIGATFINYTKQLYDAHGGAAGKIGKESRRWAWVISEKQSGTTDILESSETQLDVQNAFFVRDDYFIFDFSGACPTPSLTASITPSDTQTSFPGDEFGMCQTETSTASFSEISGDEFQACPTSTESPTVS